MRLTLWDPLMGLTTVNKSLNRLVEEGLRSAPGLLGRGLPQHRSRPPINISETDEALVLVAEVPGFGQEDIAVEVHDGRLTIKGERREEVDETRERYRRVERFNGAFERSFTLPSSVDSEGIQARLQNGLLEVTLPKASEAKRRAVSIETN